MISLFLIFGTARTQDGIRYLGEFCWEVTWIPLGENPGVLQLGILRYGRGHLAVHGKLKMIDGTDIIYSPAHGTGENFDGSIEMTLNLGEVDPFIAPSIMYVILNLPDLGGTFQQLVSESADGVTYWLERVEGTLTRILCP